SGLPSLSVRHAYTRKHSFSLFLSRLVKDLNTPRAVVKTYFTDPTKDNYYIEKINVRKLIGIPKERECQQGEDA
ncbi:unnamed protein product, partial [marine sediment metagenome]